MLVIRYHYWNYSGYHGNGQNSQVRSTLNYKEKEQLGNGLNRIQQSNGEYIKSKDDQYVEYYQKLW